MSRLAKGVRARDARELGPGPVVGAGAPQNDFFQASNRLNTLGGGRNDATCSRVSSFKSLSEHAVASAAFFVSGMTGRGG